MIEYGDPILPERFWEKVHPCPITGCWHWAGALKKKGAYGTFYIDGVAHSLSYILAKVRFGEFDKEKWRPVYVCKNYACANPEHIMLWDNSLCRNGHKKTSRGRGSKCNECRLNWDRANRAKHRTYSGSGKPTKLAPSEVSVFGDKKPSKPWRPGIFSEEVAI